MFKGISNIFEYTSSEILTTNLKYWLDYSFLQIGGYISVSGSTLNYDQNNTWNTFHQNLVWEIDTSPQVYVNSIVNNDYNLDYIKGRVIFNNTIQSNSNVTMDFSYKLINIYGAEEVDWFNQIQLDTFTGKSKNEMQLPAIVIETISKSFRPYQLGLGQYSDNIIIFHVIGQSKSDVNRISDILCEQNEKTIYLFDLQKLKDDNNLPLNSLGYLNSGALNYEQLVIPKEDGGYRWRKMTFFNAINQEIDQFKNGIFHRAVRLRAELVLTDI